MNRAVVAVVAGVVVLALVVAGALALGLSLGGGPTSSSGAVGEATRAAPTPSPLPAGDDARVPPEPALAAFYDQQLDWTACGAGSGGHSSDDCATLRVPVDYADPTGDTIELAVLRVPASSGKPVASMVVNPGGPGAPGTGYAAAADRVFGRALTENLDVVGFDPRGTGASDPVDCLSDTELDTFLAADPDPDKAADVRGLVAAQRAFFAGCAQRSDALLGHVTTAEAARDIDVLRAALGESQLTYFGASYGTKLGATYAELFPERVGRLVLDGAVDVALPSRQLSLGQAGGFETALRAYVGYCVENVSGCFLGDSLEEGLATITDLLDQVDQQPLATSEARELTVGNAFFGLVAPLYNRDYWPLLDQALRAGLAGDGTALLRLSDLYASRAADGHYTDNSSEAIYAINCLDDPYAVPAARIPSQFAAFEKASPTFGKVFAWSLIGCTGITERSSEPPLTVDAAGAAPIVVVGTTRDPATPYAWAVSLAEELDSGVLVTRDGDGHTGYLAGNACVDDAVESYLLEGTVPEDGLTC